jgi:hypothetical protein
MTVTKLDWLTHYEGTARDERNQGVSSGRNCKVIAMRTKPREGKMKPITPIISRVLEEEEMVVSL